MAHSPHRAAEPAPGHGVPDHASGHPHDEHDHDTSKYWWVFLALCFLTVISVGTMYSGIFKDTPTVAWAVMMAVSCAKAMLVITFFMHLLWEANWKYVLTIPAATMSLFLIFMLVPDVGLRTWWYTEERQHFAADPTAEARQNEPHGDHPTPDAKGPHKPGEPDPKDDRHKEPGHKEPGHKEPGHKEPGHKEPGHKEPGHKEPGHKDGK